MSRRALVAQSRAELLLQLRRGENLIVTLAVPLGILVFFAKVDTTIPSDFAHPVDFLVPGVLSLAVMAAAMVSLGKHNNLANLDIEGDRLAWLGSHQIITPENVDHFYSNDSLLTVA